MASEPKAEQRQTSEEDANSGEGFQESHSLNGESSVLSFDDPTFNLELFKYNPLETVVVDRHARVWDYNIAKRKSGGRLPARGDVMYRDYAADHGIDMHAELMECMAKNVSKTFPALKYHDRYLHITLSPFPKGAIIVSQNVTERVEAEQALKQSEERYRRLFDRVPVGMLRASADGALLDANTALLQIFGFPDKESMLSIHLADLFASVEHFERTLERLKQEETLRDFEAPVYRYDGTRIWIRMSARVVLDGPDRTPRIEGAVQDITERKRTEEALLKSEQEKALILSSVLELVTYQDLDHRILWGNQLAEETLGAQPGGLTGRKCHALWARSDEPCPDCPIPRILGTDAPQHTEKRSPDGRIWATRGYPVRDAAGTITGIVEVHLDVTHQKRAEEEKVKIQAQLLQSQKMEAVGTLAGGVAHDFNNLLTAIQGCLELAVEKLPDESPIRRDLEEVQNASHRAADLTRQLLMFSRRHLIHMAPIQLNRTIDDLLKMLHRLIGEDIVIQTALDPGLWAIQADRGTVEQVIVNLAINGRDAMPNGGRLLIKTENVDVDEFTCRLMHEAKPGRFVRLSLSDTGIGMDAAIRERIFEPFFSTKGPGKGTGLGLSVVYGIVRQHNGWVNVYSEPGQGAEFKVYFPVATGTPQEAAAPAGLQDDVNGRGERILIVEDEKCVREFSLHALEKYGYLVTAMSTVSDALRAFEGGGGAFDLVFTDVVLPDASGLSMIERMLEINPSVRVLVTSGYTDTKSQWSSIQQKGLRFLQKPYTLADLLRTIRTQLTAK
jgi:two-component system, cell cycle sensor histidine kinase and response regulator CckA